MEQNILVKQPHRTGRLAYCPECKQIHVREIQMNAGCPDCAAYGATWLTNCPNPIHARKHG